MAATLASGCFLGKVLSRRISAGIHLTATQHKRSDWLPVHAHQNAYFCLVQQGSFHERVGQQTRHCKPSMLVFHPPQEEHSECIETETSASFNIELEPAWLQGVSAEAKTELESCDVSAPELKQLARRIYREFTQTDDIAPLAIQGLTLQLLAGLLRVHHRDTQPPAWLLRVKSLIHDQFQEKIDWRMLATEAGVHPVYLVQCFRRHLGYTPGEYQRLLRIQWAEQQLRASSLSLAQIAYQAGFADQSHLTRYIKQHLGTTPSALRRS